MKSSFPTFWVNVWNWILSSELRQIYSFESKLLHQSANRHQLIPHPRNTRTELRIDLQDDGADSVPSVTVTRAPDALLVAPCLDTKEATCSLTLKSGHCHWRIRTQANLPVSFLLSDSFCGSVGVINNALLLGFCSQWPFWFRAQKAEGSTPTEQCECKPLITVN